MHYAFMCPHGSLLEVDAKHAAPSSSQVHKDAAAQASSDDGTANHHGAHAQQQEPQAQGTAAGMQAGTPVQQVRPAFVSSQDDMQVMCTQPLWSSHMARGHG